MSCLCIVRPSVPVALCETVCSARLLIDLVLSVLVFDWLDAGRWILLIGYTLAAIALKISTGPQTCVHLHLGNGLYGS